MFRCQHPGNLGRARVLSALVGAAGIAALSCSAMPAGSEIRGRPASASSDAAVVERLLDDAGEGSAANLAIGARDVRNALNLLLAVVEGPAAEEVAVFLGARGSQQSYLEAERNRVATLERSTAAADGQVRHAAALWVRGRGGKRSDRAQLGERLGAEIHLFERDRDPAADIDAWVAEKSAGRVKSVFPRELGGDVNTVAVTVGVFDGVWQQPFDAKRTKPEPFFAAGGSSSDVLMMTGLREAPLVRAERYAALALRFSAAGRWFVIVVGAAGARDLPPSAALGEALEALFADDVEHQLVRVSLPRFAISTNLDLAPVLRRNGIAAVFDRPSIVTGVSELEPLRLGAFRHACELKLDEKGVKAASATVQVMHSRSVRQPDIEEFRADRPFYFAVWDQTTKTVLYAGRYTEPAAEGKAATK